MKLVFLPVVFLAMVAPAAAQLDGAFTLRSSERDDRVSLNLQYRRWPVELRTDGRALGVHGNRPER